VPLAKAGFNVVAVDNAAAMLDRLRMRLESAGKGVKKRVTIIQADMSEYKPSKRYALVIVAYNSLQYLKTTYRIRSLVTNVAQVLMPEGYLLVALRNRGLSPLKAGQQYVVDWTEQPVVDEEKGLSVGQKTVECYDKNSDQLVEERTYEIRYKDRPPEVITETTYAPAIEVKDYIDVLEGAGFAVKAYGGYDKRELTSDCKIARLACRQKAQKRTSGSH
jgi:SAM-dependent methyltransferase